jgi:hypothetical protein
VVLRRFPRGERQVRSVELARAARARRVGRGRSTVCLADSPSEGRAASAKWIHDQDIVGAVRFLIERDDLAVP